MSTTFGNREYDVIVWGASGYTGALTAEHISRSFPTNIRWAIAGRSAGKLETVVRRCQQVNPNATKPAIEICNLDEAELADLARKTTILIATVGPYSKFGEPAVKACAENGTHYMDVTGEFPWTHAMTKKYQKIAETTGAILIPQLGIESTPSDLIAYSCVALNRQMLGAPTREVIMCVHDWKSQASGGTLASALGIVEHFSLKELAEAGKPFINSPIPGPKAPTSKPWYSSLLGIRHVPLLGTLTTFVGAVSDVPIVERSWALLGADKVYGPNFRYSEYIRVNNPFKGMFVHFALFMGQIILLMPWMRWILRRIVTQPGEGADASVTSSDHVDYRAVGYPDMNTTKKVYAKAAYQGGLYKLTGIMLGEAALTLLKDDVPAKKLGGGFMTPATLGQAFIDRLGENGFKFEAKMLE